MSAVSGESPRQRSGAARRHRRAVLTGWILACWMMLPTAGGGLEAANGDLISSHSGLSSADLVDLCRDTSDGTFWAASQTRGVIYHLDENLAYLSTDDVANPHGSFSAIGNPLRTRGLAYREDSDTLLVLALRRAIGDTISAFELREIAKDGTEVTPAAISIVPPQPDSADLSGLTWDPISNRIWYLDARNDQVVRSTLDGTAEISFSVRSPGSPESRVYGNGLDFELHPNGLTGFIHVAYGDVFTLGPSEFRRFSITGVNTGFAMPLPEGLGSRVLGVTMTELQGNDVAVVISPSASGGSMLHVVDREETSPLPPSDLQCVVDLQDRVKLCWTNHGFGGIYPGGLQIRRNGSLLVTLPGTTTCFRDNAPPKGLVTYSVIGSDGSLSEPRSCTAQTGGGGLVRWRPFPGGRVHDVCRNPATGQIYATDISQGQIFRFEANLELSPAGLLPNPLPSPFARPGGIAFDPEGNGGEGSLLVANSEGVLMREISLSGNPIDAGIPMSPPSKNNVVSGLTYDPATRQLAYIDQSSGQIVFISRTGLLVDAVTPPAFLTGELALGITHNPVTSRYFANFDGGQRVFEIFSSGIPTGFDFGLLTLGQSSVRADALGGLALTGNTMLVCGTEANALFEVLVAPTGAGFLRGDANTSSVVDISDPIFIAEYMFLDGAEPQCQDAADANDDGFLDISDPVYLFFHLFLGGPAPLPPYPEQGTDPTFLDGLDCQGNSP